MTAQFRRNLTDFIRADLMILRGAVREVHTYHVSACGNNLLKVVIAVGSRA